MLARQNWQKDNRGWLRSLSVGCSAPQPTAMCRASIGGYNSTAVNALERIDPSRRNTGMAAGIRSHFR